MKIQLYRTVTICYRESERDMALAKQKSYQKRGYSLEVAEDEISGDPDYPLAVQLLQTTTRYIQSKGIRLAPTPEWLRNADRAVIRFPLRYPLGVIGKNK